MGCIYNRRTSGINPSKRANTYDIDDFIQQLLTSEKFDELAEKVAEKAVNKIRSMGSYRDGDHRVIINENPYRYQEKKRDYDQQRLVLKEREQRSITKANNVKKNTGTINTQVLLKQEDESGQVDGLTLKYKYMKKNSPDRKPMTNQRYSSEERNPIWRNIEITSEKQRPQRMSGEDRASVNKPSQFSKGSLEKGINYDKSISIDKNKNYEKNINYEKHNNDTNQNNEKKFEQNADKSINFDKPINFDKKINFEKNTNYDRNPTIEKKYKNFEKNRNVEVVDNNYQIQEEHKTANGNEMHSLENDYENLKITRPRDDRESDESNVRYRPVLDPKRQTFQSENPLPYPLRMQKAITEDSPPFIDLDDNDSQTIKIPVVEENNNVYKTIVDQQNSMKKDYNDDEGNDDDRNVRDDDQKKIFGVDVNSDNDSGYQKQRNDDDAPVKSGYEQDENQESITTRQAKIRREGNQYYTYMSAPEYAEYHEMVAKLNAKPK